MSNQKYTRSTPLRLESKKTKRYCDIVFFCELTSPNPMILTALLHIARGRWLVLYVGSREQYKRIHAFTHLLQSGLCRSNPTILLCHFLLTAPPTLLLSLLAGKQPHPGQPRAWCNRRGCKCRKEVQHIASQKSKRVV